VLVRIVVTPSRLETSFTVPRVETLNNSTAVRSATMSASGSLQRANTARTDIESQRMPFEAAEALLWGRKTHKDHEWLFSQMKELQSQHEAYDTRIKATEAIAETAEAATHRIRHMETKLAAIESDDKDRPFDKWAENAITQLKLFADNNLNVRQKLNSLEGRFCEAVDDLDKVSGVSKDVASLLRRLDDLEKERKEDKNQLMLMGREIASFRAMRQMPPSGHALQTNPVRLEMPHSGQAADHESHDSDTTTEEDHIPLSRSLVQVPRSPSVNLE
jgi:predicted RNase H-like nuclease (RuvC/YqgF family)